VKRRFGVAIAAASLLAGVVAQVALAETPIFYNDIYADNTQINWAFSSSTYASWITVAAIDALDTNWDNPAKNNSRSPQFHNVSSASPHVKYLGQVNSPCSTVPNPVWLGSACTAGTPNWTIYIHNLDAVPYHDASLNKDWAWYDETSSCQTSTDMCFWLRRTLIHEPIHLTGGGSTHSSQDAAYTVFTKGQHSYATTGWNYETFRACDEAGSQLAYNLRTYSGPYADCFANITDSGAIGLKTDLDLSTATNIEVCQGTAVTVSGRLQVSHFASYDTLSDNPLQGRSVKFDLSGSTVSSTAASGAETGSNWSATFTNVSYGSRSYMAHFDGGIALEVSPHRTFGITWLPNNLC
jgi:hypothetical protein